MSKISREFRCDLCVPRGEAADVTRTGVLRSCWRGCPLLCQVGSFARDARSVLCSRCTIMFALPHSADLPSHLHASRRKHTAAICRCSRGCASRQRRPEKRYFEWGQAAEGQGAETSHIRGAFADGGRATERPPSASACHPFFVARWGFSEGASGADQQAPRHRKVYSNCNSARDTGPLHSSRPAHIASLARWGAPLPHFQ